MNDNSNKIDREGESLGTGIKGHRKHKKEYKDLVMSDESKNIVLQ